MMVTRAYLLDRSARPSAAKRLFNQRAMPVLIDTAGAIEQELERIAASACRAPRLSVGTAAGLGCLLGVMLVHATRRTGRG